MKYFSANTVRVLLKLCVGRPCKSLRLSRRIYAPIPFHGFNNDEKYRLCSVQFEKCLFIKSLLHSILNWKVRISLFMKSHRHIVGIHMRGKKSNNLPVMVVAFAPHWKREAKMVKVLAEHFPHRNAKTEIFAAKIEANAHRSGHRAPAGQHQNVVAPQLLHAPKQQNAKESV